MEEEQEKARLDSRVVDASLPRPPSVVSRMTMHQQHKWIEALDFGSGGGQEQQQLFVSRSNAAQLLRNDSLLHWAFLTLPERSPEAWSGKGGRKASSRRLRSNLSDRCTALQCTGLEFLNFTLTCRVLCRHRQQRVDSALGCGSRRRAPERLYRSAPRRAPLQPSALANERGRLQGERRVQDDAQTAQLQVDHHVLPGAAGDSSE